MTVKIAPSLLSADFANLKAEVRDIEKGGADWLHLDVMDGHFVPNLTFGPDLVAAVKANSQIFLDIHLMITNPLKYAGDFVRAGSDMVTFHLEAEDNPDEVIASIKDLGAQAGMVVSPDTPVDGLAPYLSKLEMILIMSVHPGFGGQSFMPQVLPKMAALRNMGFQGEIEIDGGISPKTAPEAIAAGATVLVAGSAVFGKKDRKSAIDALRPIENSNNTAE